MQKIIKSVLSIVFGAFVACDVAALGVSQVLLPLSSGEIKLGEWNRNFDGGLSIANAYHVPLVVFFGGLSCGKCEELQRACLTDEFVSWQEKNKMVMIFTTDNSNAKNFAIPENSSGFPFMAVYWNRDDAVPEKNSAYYLTFNGRDGEMPVKEGTLANQFIKSIEMVTAGYVYDASLDISERAEMLYAEPVTTKLNYDLFLFTTIDSSPAFPPQKIYNVSDAYKIVMKKVSGKLPTGIKLTCEAGFVKLSGTAKTAGTYTYQFALHQNRLGVDHAGPTITLNFSIAAANDVAAGGCALLGKLVKTTVPLYLEEGENRVLKGVLELNLTAQNKIQAKYYGMSRSPISFGGGWSTIADGTARASLKATGGQELVLALGGAGSLTADVTDPAYDAALSSGAPLTIGIGSYASAFGGTYTVSLAELSATSGTGCGFVVVKRIAKNGRAQWLGVLPNGQNVSGNAFVTLDGDGNAVLPVFKYSGRDYIAAPLKIRPGIGEQDEPRAVVGCAGTLARWGHHAAPVSVHDCMARGSWYGKSPKLDECCYQQFSANVLTLSAVTDGFTSARYGAVATAPSGDVQVTTDKISLVERTPDLKISFTKATGIFKGSMKVAMASGAVTAKFAGVVIPGWHDCNCSPQDFSDPFHIDVSQPFAVGAAWFADTEGGASAKRGFTVKIDEKAY